MVLFSAAEEPGDATHLLERETGEPLLVTDLFSLLIWDGESSFYKEVKLLLLPAPSLVLAPSQDLVLQPGFGACSCSLLSEAAGPGSQLPTSNRCVTGQHLC